MCNCRAHCRAALADRGGGGSVLTPRLIVQLFAVNRPTSGTCIPHCQCGDWPATALRWQFIQAFIAAIFLQQLMLLTIRTEPFIVVAV